MAKFGTRRFGEPDKDGGIKDVFGSNPNMALQYNRGEDNDPDAQIYIDALTSNGMDDTTSNTLYGFNYTTLQGHINTYFLALKDAGLFSKMAAMYLFIGDDSLQQGINAKSPGTDDLTFFNTVGGDFTGTGWQGNGTNSYADLGILANSLTAADHHIMNYARGSASGGSDMGADGGAIDLFLINRTAGDVFHFRTTDVNLLPANTDGEGMFLGTVRASGDLESYMNGTTALTSGSAISTLPAFDIYLGARNNSGTPSSSSAREYVAASIGTSMTDADVTAYSNALNTLQTALGRNTY